MSDVLKWLQNMANEEWEYEDGDYALEAIKFFNSLRAENKRLREALSYYAEEDYNGYNGNGACARAALEGVKEPPTGDSNA